MQCKKSDLQAQITSKFLNAEENKTQPSPLFLYISHTEYSASPLATANQIAPSPNIS